MGQDKKITIGLLIGWLLGGACLLPGITYLFTQPTLGLLFLAITLIIFPPFVGFIKSKTGFTLSAGVKILLFLILFYLIGKNEINSSLESSEKIMTNSLNAKVIEESSQKKSRITKKPLISLGKYTVKNEGFIFRVIGEVTNNDKVEHTFSLVATFYAEDGSILGTATGIVDNLAPSDTKTYTLVGTDDIKNSKRIKVQLDSMY